MCVSVEPETNPWGLPSHFGRGRRTFETVPSRPVGLPLAVTLTTGPNDRRLNTKHHEGVWHATDSSGFGHFGCAVASLIIVVAFLARFSLSCRSCLRKSRVDLGELLAAVCTREYARLLPQISIPGSAVCVAGNFVYFFNIYCYIYFCIYMFLYILFYLFLFL